MVKGLVIFREYFRDFKDQYVLIGGTACSVTFERTGEEFRATRDLDVVIYLENLTDEFVRALWKFIEDAGYKNRQQSTGKKLFYRFFEPSDVQFPDMLELFAREPDKLTLSGSSHLTPIPVDEEMQSLSAILLDDEYYQFVLNGSEVVEELSVLHESYILILKAKSWLDNKRLQEKGVTIQKNDINKHKNDVFRIYRILDPDVRIELPVAIKEDFSRFLEEVRSSTVDLKALGLKQADFEGILADLAKMYSITT